MSTHLRLAWSSPEPVDADWKTDAYLAERHRRLRLSTGPLRGDDVTAASRTVDQSGEDVAATLVRDQRSRRHEEGAHTAADDSVDRPDERVIWSPFRRQRRRRSGPPAASPGRRAPAPSSPGSARPTGAGLGLVLLLGLCLLSTVALAQTDVTDGPNHAHATRYGIGWECDWGYRTVAKSCEPIIVPAHAHLDAFGDRWDCDRGYRRVTEACAAVEVPPHAFLTSSGHGWQCDRGYQRRDRSCAAVLIPADAYLSTSGDSWTCERGFRRRGTSCVVLVVPLNAHIGYSDNAWMCHPGYRQHGDTCLPDEQ